MHANNAAEREGLFGLGKLVGDSKFNFAVKKRWEGGVL